MNNVICDVMYSIRDCINDGNTKAALVLSKELTALIASSHTMECKMSCSECNSNKDLNNEIKNKA